MAEQAKIATCLSIMRRMPPNKIEQNLSGLLNLAPDCTDELLQRIDQPLEEATDPTTGRKYVICDYNRDGDSYRSPWSNRYYPPIADGFTPSPQLRQLEVDANELFDAYRYLYYDTGVSSVYLWDLDNGFAGCFVIRKAVEQNRFVKQGSWNSIHILEVIQHGATSATYKLTTTILLSMSVEKEEVGQSNLSGTLTRQAEKNLAVDEEHNHLFNMGTMIEDMEISMRKSLDNLYIQKTREVVNSIRHLGDGPSQGDAFTGQLRDAVLHHGTGRKVDSDV